MDTDLLNKTPKNIASLTIALNEEDMIGGCLELLDVDYKLVLIPTKTFSGKEIVKFDNTEKIAREKGAVVIFTDAATEPEARNFGLDHLQKLGYEYALIVDADEYWPKETQHKMVRLIAEQPSRTYKADLDYFFKRPNWKITDMTNTRTIVAIKTDKRFSAKGPRKVAGWIEYVNPGTIYHFSYVRRPEKIKEKIESFSHAHEIIKNWYENVYTPFTPASTNFHPVKPHGYPRCVEYKLPEEIASKIPKHLWLT